MKIYVVTYGSYSDYTISKVFTDENKAKEYAEWLYDSNDIEEYETEDDLEVNKFYNVNINLKVYADGREELTKYFYKTDQCDRNNTWYNNYSKYGGNYFTLSINRNVSADNWNETLHINKYIKAIYDISARVKIMMQEGLDERQINKILNGNEYGK